MMSYRAFISYSHAADASLAAALQSGLHRFAKPWYRLRALRTFRDKTSLAASPALWPSIEAALEASDFFILLASPKAAESSWVAKEIEFWLRTNGPDRLLLVVTAGALVWDPIACDFDPARSTALPPALRGTFNQEPLFVELQWASHSEQRSLQNPRFREAVGQLAATLRAQPFDELAGEDVRQHRRTRRTAWSAVIALALLAVGALLAAVVAVNNQRVAEQRLKLSRAQELAAQSRLNLDQASTTLSGLLAVESLRLSQTLHGQLAWEQVMRLLPHRRAPLKHRRPVLSLALSPDGRYLVTGTESKPQRSLERTEDGFTERGDIERTVHIWETANGRARMSAPVSDAGQEVTISPEGHWLAARTGDSNGQLVSVWRVKDGAAVLPRLESWNATSLDFGASGLLAVGTREGKVRVWRIEPQEETLSSLLGALRGLFPGSGTAVAGSAEQIHEWDHEGEVGSVAFSPDGRLLATGSGGPFGGPDTAARIWDMATGKQLEIFEHKNSVEQIAFSPDGRWFATVSRDEFKLGFSPPGGWPASVRLWDASSWEQVARLEHDYEIYDFAFSPNGDVLTTVAAPGFIRLWQSTTGEEQSQIRPASGVSSVAFTPDGRYLAGATGDGNARIWEIETGQELARIPHDGRVSDLEFSSDGEWLATASSDKTARLSALRATPEAFALWSKATLLDVFLSLEPPSWQSGEQSGSGAESEVRSPAVQVEKPFDAPLRKVSRPLLQSRVPVQSTLLETALAGSPVWIEAHTTAEKGPIRGLRFSRDRTRVAVLDRDNTIKTWDLGRSEPLAEVGHETPVREFALSTDGRWLLTISNASLDRPGSVQLSGPRATVAIVWETSSGREILRLEDENIIHAADFSPDGTKLLVAGQSNRGGARPGEGWPPAVRVWEISSGTEIVRMHYEVEVLTAVFDTDGNRIATGAVDRTARIWDARDGKQLAEFLHADPVGHVTFSKDGRWLATASGGQARVWELSSGRELIRFSHDAWVRVVAFAGQDRWLWTGTEGEVRLWPWLGTDLVTQACQRLPRNLTQAEWEQFVRDEPYRASCSNLPLEEPEPKPKMEPFRIQVIQQEPG